jgi:alpha-galactosidase
VLIVLGQSIQFRRPIPRLRLRGLEPDALYRVNGGKALSGRALMQIGVAVDLVADFDSKLYRIERQA